PVSRCEAGESRLKQYHAVMFRTIGGAIKAKIVSCCDVPNYWCRNQDRRIKAKPVSRCEAGESRLKQYHAVMFRTIGGAIKAKIVSCCDVPNYWCRNQDRRIMAKTVSCCDVPNYW
ncbi:hypothetical protein AVEN_177954-1, partial [Araneus ventricosus]